MTVIGSGNVCVPFLNPTTSGLACSHQGARGSEGVYSVGVLASSLADHLYNMCQVACLWLGCCQGIYSPSYCHITTCDIGVIEKHDLFFGHNWLSIWIEIQLQFANCIILIESFYNLLKLKSICSHWIISSFYLKLIQFWSIIKSPSCLLLFQYHTVLEYPPGRNANILRMPFLNEFSWMESFVY